MTPRSIRQAFGPYAKLYVPKEPSLVTVVVINLITAAVVGALTGMLIVLPALYL